MAFCKYCGNKTEDGAVFCGLCGKPLLSHLQPDISDNNPSKLTLIKNKLLVKNNIILFFISLFPILDFIPPLYTSIEIFWINGFNLEKIDILLNILSLLGTVLIVIGLLIPRRIPMIAIGSTVLCVNYLISLVDEVIYSIMDRPDYGILLIMKRALLIIIYLIIASDYFIPENIDRIWFLPAILSFIVSCVDSFFGYYGSNSFVLGYFTAGFYYSLRYLLLCIRLKKQNELYLNNDFR